MRRARAASRRGSCARCRPRARASYRPRSARPPATGERGRREHSLYLFYEAPHRNAVWQAGHKQLPILVMPPGPRRVQRPWMTLFLDDFSRAIMGCAISLRPSSAKVLAALRDALVVDTEPRWRLARRNQRRFAARFLNSRAVSPTL